MRQLVFLILVSLIGLSAPAGRPVQPGIVLGDTLPEGCRYENLHVRAKATTGKAASWGLVWGYTDSLNYCCARLRLPAARDVSDVYANDVRVEAVRYVDGRPLTLLSTAVKDGVGVDGRYNSVKLVGDPFGARLYVGEHTQVSVGNVPFLPGAMGVVSDVPIDLVRMDAVYDQEGDLGTCPLSADEISGRLESSSDPIEGLYEYLDRDIDMRLANIGGYYRVAVLRQADGTYHMVYLSGAADNVARWAPGRVKAVLIPTIFKGNYDMRWLCSDGTMLTDGTNAQYTDDASVITLHFPLEGSQIRLRRVLNGK